MSVASEHQLPEEKEAHRSDNLDEYSEIQLLNRNGPHYTPLEFEEQQDPPELQKAPVRFPAICTFRKSKAYIYTFQTYSLVLPSRHMVITVVMTLRMKTYEDKDYHLSKR